MADLKMHSFDELEKMDFPKDEFEPVNIMKGGQWFIQNSKPLANDWRLSNEDDQTEYGYAFELHTEHDIIRALAHISEKTWVDRLALLNGLMPAIVFFDHGRKNG